ncbi:MAG: hypothetical protein KA207_08470 [Burkholderiaceae bacterium]|jgi:hypothetical protein|nr:hypothetical protein [Burkholderiaceae bacterium]
MNKLLRLFASQPHLLLAHASSYAALVREQGDRSLSLLCQRVYWLALAYASFVVGATLVGVALMLWIAVPQSSIHLPWLLALVPSVALLVGMWAMLLAKRISPMPLWSVLQKQLDEDLALFSTAAP